MKLQAERRFNSIRPQRCDIQVTPVSLSDVSVKSSTRQCIDIGTDINCLIPVSDTPSFAITRLPGFGIPIVEGMSVSLKCEVDSNPASTPIWQRGKWRVEKENKKKRERNMTLLLIPQTNADSREN